MAQGAKVKKQLSKADATCSAALSSPDTLKGDAGRPPKGPGVMSTVLEGKEGLGILQDSSVEGKA